MNLRYKTIVFSLLMSGMTLVSCDDFLTQENIHQLTTQNFYKTIGDCEKGLAAVYNALKNTNIYHPLDENRRSDIAVEGNKDRKQFDNEAYKQTFNDSYGTVRGKWSALYTGVFRANQVLASIEKIRPNVTDEPQITKLAQIEAQAYSLRGLFYFYLNNSFNNGNVPYINEIAEVEEDYYKKVTPSDEIKKYYREDLQKALDLGLNDKWEKTDLGRITSWAVKAILGKSYLYDKEYNKAAEYFKDIIDNGGFALVDDIVDNFTAANEFNSESILEVSYSTQYNTEFGTWSESTLYNIWGMNVNGLGDAWLNTVPAFWLVEAFETEPVDRLDERNWIKMQSDNYGDPEHRDIIYDQLGTTFSSQVDRQGVVYNRTYVYTWDATAGKYVGVRERLVSTVGDNKVLYNKITGYDDIVPEFKWEDGQAYRLRSYSMRASASLAINGDESLIYYQSLPQQVSKFNRGSSAYFRKLSNWDTRKSETEFKPAMASGINYRLIRLADIYLMYAECLIKGGASDGNVQSAINAINKVRHRAGVVLIGKSEQGEFKRYTYDEKEYAASDVMNHLMYVERPLELCMEGHAIRVIDLRRWNITKERFDQLASDEYKYCMIQTKYLKPNPDDPNALVSAFNFGKQYRFYELPPEKRGNAFVDYFQASLNYGPQVAYWPIPNIEITSNPDINK